MQRSLEYYFKGESSGVAAVSGSSSGLQKREKEKVMINVLFTKRRSMIAPKSRDNYPYILNVRHLRYLIIIFWLFNSKLYGIAEHQAATVGASPSQLPLPSPAEPRTAKEPRTIH